MFLLLWKVNTHTGTLDLTLSCILRNPALLSSPPLNLWSLLPSSRQPLSCAKFLHSKRILLPYAFPPFPSQRVGYPRCIPNPIFIQPISIIPNAKVPKDLPVAKVKEYFSVLSYFIILKHITWLGIFYSWTMWLLRFYDIILCWCACKPFWKLFISLPMFTRVWSIALFSF